MKKKRIILLCILAVMFCLAGCGKEKKNSDLITSNWVWMTMQSSSGTLNNPGDGKMLFPKFESDGTNFTISTSSDKVHKGTIKKDGDNKYSLYTEKSVKAGEAEINNGILSITLGTIVITFELVK